MKKYALGAAIAAVGVVTHSMPASADKLDQVLERLEAIEQNNAKLAKENAALRARLNRVETVKSAPIVMQAAPAGRGSVATRTVADQGLVVSSLTQASTISSTAPFGPSTEIGPAA